MSKNLKRGDRVTIIGGYRATPRGQIHRTGIVTNDYDGSCGMLVDVMISNGEKLLLFRNSLRKRRGKYKQYRKEPTHENHP